MYVSIGIYGHFLVLLKPNIEGMKECDIYHIGGLWEIDYGDWFTGNFENKRLTGLERKNWRGGYRLLLSKRMD